MRLISAAAAGALLLLCMTTDVSALETSMLLRQGGSNASGLYVIIEPGLGNITLYSVEGNSLTKHGSANFIEDLNFIDQLVLAERNGVPYSALRVGSTNCKPSSEEVFEQLPSTATATETAHNLKSYQERARAAEDTFWQKPHPYNGVVRGALGSTSLMLCIPSKHALMVYDISNVNKGPILNAWHNYGSELYVPQILSSSPTPEALLNQLPANVREKFKKAVDEQMTAQAKGGGALTLKDSDETWVGVDTADRFVLVDQPNKHVLTYEYNGKNWRVVSSRNLEIDLLIPTSMSSTPLESDELKDYVAAHRQKLAEYGILPDVAYFKALVGSKQVSSGKVSELQAHVSGEDLGLEFLNLHKVFFYRLLGANNGLELVAMRDYTLDIGMQLQDDEFAREEHAANAWDTARGFIADRKYESAMFNVKLALQLNPCIFKAIEKDPRSKQLHTNPDWQATIDTAIKACDTLTKDRADRLKKAQENRDAEAKGQ